MIEIIENRIYITPFGYNLLFNYKLIELERCELIMNDKKSNSKCENCGAYVNLFKVTILSPCKEHSHTEIYCMEHMSSVIIEFPEDIDLIEKI